ncbi:MAG: TonB-dependent receptor [Rhodothalassiaceae bacterium]|nr:MAG: TonB-dependent receptor [Rhodothalassiaceae bacterium]
MVRMEKKLLTLLLGSVAVGSVILARSDVAYGAPQTTANPATPQSTPQQQSEEEDALVEEIVITGSRIKRAGFDTLQPAVQINADFIDERGFDNVAGAINEIPAFGIPLDPLGGQAAQSIGQNFANAFNLGTQRTLTLLNGRRVVGQNTPGIGSGAEPGLQVDLNIVPTALIDRVETIFTGGAPIYGTDAIAGTINIILKKDFEGFSAEAQYGIDQRGTGSDFRVRGLWGANTGDGRGNVTLAAEYSTQTAIDAVENKVARQQWGFCENPEAGIAPDSAGALQRGLPIVNSSDGIPNLVLCRFSGNVWQVPNSGMPLIGPFASANGDGALRDRDGNPLVFDANGNLVTWQQAGLGTPRSIFFSRDTDGFANPLIIGLDETNSIRSPLDRWIINGTARYEVADGVDLFIEALYARAEAVDRNNQPPWSTNFFAPGAAGAIQININDNPFITDQLRQALIDNGAYDPNLDADGDGVTDPQFFFLTRSNVDIVEGSPNFRDQDVFRYVTGFEGSVDFLGRSWDWDTAFIFGESNATTRQSEINGPRYALALDAVVDTRVDDEGNPVNPETFGKIVCRAQIDPPETFFGDVFAQPPISDIDECIPFNPFGLQNLTPEQRAYLVQQNFQATKIRQLVYEANISGDLVDLPAGPVGVAGGFTHRREQARFNVDRASFIGIDPNTPVQNVRGKFNTTEVYGETLIPIIQDGSDLEVPGITKFQAEGALRFVDNSRSGNDVTWTAGGRLQLDLPVVGKAFEFRGNFTQAIRAPAVQELFLPRSQIFTFATDPCDRRFINAGPNPAIRRRNCEAQVAMLKAQGVLPKDFNLDDFVSLIVNRSDRGFTGGNPDLRNERSKSWTVGVVFTPEFLPGFTMSVDWTDIRLRDEIVSLSATQILNACFDSPDFPNEACTRFRRDEEFQIRDPETGFLNAAVRNFAGLVANVEYKFEASDIVSSLPGTINIFGSFFHVARHDRQVTGQDLDLIAGELGSERLRFQLNLRYSLDRFTFLWQTQHFGSFFIFGRQAPDEIAPEDQKRTPAARIHNLTLRYQLTENIYVRTVVNNVFDKVDDPLRAAARGGNNLNFRDVIGRRFLFAVGVDF